MGAKVAVIMGSKSDWSCMQEATQIMDRLGVSYEVEVVSAHRTPDKLMEFSSKAAGRGIQVIIAGAGGAAGAGAGARVPATVLVRECTSRVCILVGRSEL